MSFEFIAEHLRQRQQQGLLRQHTCIDGYDGCQIQIAGGSYLNFASNDYLGLAQTLASDLPKLPIGSSSSPLINGFSWQHQQLCDHIAKNTEREAVLLFSSGFAANYAVCQALMGDSKQLILSDKLAHASLVDGALAAKAEYKRFRHNDVAHLQKLLGDCANDYSDKLVVTEGVFSMDGDCSPTAPLVRTCQEHDAWLMLDDAHGIGVLGDRGWGTVEAGGYEQEHIAVLVGTFGKAVGTGGAFVAGSQALIDYLSNYARHYIYSTAFSPMHAQITLSQLQRMESEAWRREKLRNNICLFQRLAQEHGLDFLPSESAIQPLMVGEPNKALSLSQALRDRGIWVPAVRHPTVPKNKDRLRFTLTSMHDEQDLVRLFELLAELRVHDA